MRIMEIRNHQSHMRMAVIHNRPPHRPATVIHRPNERRTAAMTVTERRKMHARKKRNDDTLRVLSIKFQPAKRICLILKSIGTKSITRWWRKRFGPGFTRRSSNILVSRSRHWLTLFVQKLWLVVHHKESWMMFKWFVTFCCCCCCCSVESESDWNGFYNGFILFFAISGVGWRGWSICCENVATPHLWSGSEKGWLRQIVNGHLAVIGESDITTIEPTTTKIIKWCIERKMKRERDIIWMSRRIYQLNHTLQTIIYDNIDKKF